MPVAKKEWVDGAERTKQDVQGETQQPTANSQRSRRLAITLSNITHPLERHYTLRTAVLFVLIACATLGTLACEEDVVSVLGTDRPYSFYGVLSPTFSQQYVRVYPIAATLEATPNAPLGANMTSRDLTTGEEVVWKDSLVQEASGDFAHVFVAPFRANFGTTYELRAERGDGALTTATVPVPPAATVELPDPELDVPALMPVTIRGLVPRLLKVEVTYAIQYRIAAPSIESRQVVVPYGEALQPTDDGWTLTLSISRDLRTIEDQLRAEGPFDRAFGIEFVELTLRMIAANDAWNPPDGTFDPEVLVQPGLLSNVDNGFGFVGAGYRLEASWEKLDTVRQEVGRWDLIDRATH